MGRRIASLMTLLVLMGAVPPTPAEPPKAPSRPSARLVSFDDLQGRLGDRGLRLLDARPNAEYDKGRIPGAIWLNPKAAEQLASRPGGLTDQAAWEAWIAPLAIGPETEVLVYDANRQKDAARFWWLLTYLGVEKTGLIDGGFLHWGREGRPVTTEVPKVSPEPFKVHFRHDRHATRAEALEALKGKRARIIDARSQAENAGAQRLSKRAGRIPSACTWSGPTSWRRTGGSWTRPPCGPSSPRPGSCAASR